jgi:tRNA(Ile2) C34 agmatinyltransferase TiaS
MPYWILVLPLSLALVVAIVRIVRLIVRIRRGLCRRCGYDLRESQAGPCPECGTRNKSGRSQSIYLDELLTHQEAGSGA